MAKNRFPFPAYPRGWFRVADSREIKRGQIKPVFFFGRDLILVRDAAGGLGMYDAHCPHLGAHLGYGGKVDDGYVVCPFHGLRFPLNGSQSSLFPCTKARTATADLRPWPVREIAEIVLAWFDPELRQAAWEAPDPDWAAQAGWTRAYKAKSFTIRSHVQEFMENGADTAHLSYLHDQLYRTIRSLEISADGPILKHQIAIELNPAQTFGKTTLADSSITFSGLGCVTVKTKVAASIPTETLLTSFPTPIDSEHIEVSTYVNTKRIGLLTMPVMGHALLTANKVFAQDVPIWEHKKYVTSPPLTQRDGPINEFREWARQFYRDPLSVGTADD